MPPPLHEIDPNVTRRNSRSSNISASTKNASRPSTSSRGNDLVAGMLRTSTETGDIGTFSATSRLHKIPRQSSFRRPTALPRGLAPSRTSSHYSRTESIRSGKSGRSFQDASSMPGSWPYRHYPFASSQPDFNSALFDSRSSVAQESVKSLPMGLADRLDQDHRSYSLTKSPPPPHALKNHPSLTSLRSQDMSQRPKSPFMPPTHLTQRNNRPISPTLSDTAGALYAKRHGARPGHAPRPNVASPYPPRESFEAYQRFATGRNGTDVLMPARRPHRIDRLKKTSVNGGPVVYHAANENLPPVPDSHPQPPYLTRQRFHGPQPRSGTQSPHRHTPRYLPGPRDTPRFRREMKTNDSGPYLGFVQRVKTVLEERISHEDVDHQQHSDSLITREVGITREASAPIEYPPEVENYYDVAPNSLQPPSDTLTKSLEESTPDQSSIVKRLTRDMVKSAMDAGSDVAAASDEAEDPTLPDDDFEASRQPPNGESEYVASSPQSQADPEREKSSPVLRSFEQPEPLRQEAHQVESRPSEAKSEGSIERPSYETHSKAHCQATVSATQGQPRSQSCEERPKSWSRDKADLITSAWPARSPGGSGTDGSEHKGDSGPKSLSMPGEFLQSRPPSFTGETEEQEAAVEPIGTAGIQPVAKLPHGSDIILTTRDESGGPAATDIPVLETDNGSEDSNAEPGHGQGDPISSLVGDRASPAVPGEDATKKSFEFPARSPPLWQPATPDGFPSSSMPVAQANTEMRPSAMKTFQTPLPELAEDSQEDASTTNLRMLGARKPGLPPRIPRDPKRRSRTTPRVPAPPEPPKTYLTRTLAESRNIPSFNFSQQDLTTKLNDALGLRSSRSLKDLSTLKSEDVTPALSRPLSSNLVRDRYKSFFTTSERSLDEDEGCADVEAAVETNSIEPQPKSTVDEDILREIDKLSIPSVKNLTLRLSELLPSIKNSRSGMNLSTVDDAVDETVEEIRALGSPARMASMDIDETIIEELKNTSQEITRKGTATTNASHSKRRGPKERVYLHLMKDLPPLPPSDDKRASQESSVASPQTRLASKEEKRKAALYEMEDPDVATTPSEEGEPASKPVHLEPSPHLKNPRSCQSLKEFGTPGTPGTPRPWNKQENYPWSGGTPTVTITDDHEGPNGTLLEKAPRLKLKKPRSDGDFSVNQTERIVRSMSPGPKFNASLVPQTDVFTTDNEAVVNKRDLLGSLKRKIGLGQRQNKAGIPVDPIFLHPEDYSATRPVKPGDRYPTSSLTPPGALNIDESRSYFSDDSSESEHVHGLRKRLTRLKAKRSAPGNFSASESGSDTHQSPESNTVGPNNSRLEFEHPNIFQQHHTPVGMSKSEFHAKKLIEKLRVFFVKTGEVLRRIHRPKQHDRGWHEGRQTYEGV